MSDNVAKLNAATGKVINTDAVDNPASVALDEADIWMSVEERQRVVTELAQKGHLEKVELTLRKKNGELINTIAGGEVFTLGRHRYILSFFFDITERKRIEEALQQRTMDLKHLTEALEERLKERTAESADPSSQLVSAQEKERKRISYELHDIVWQTLEIIQSQIEHLFSRADEADWAAFQQNSKQLIPLIRNTVARIRSMQGDLWPSVLDDIGILATLEWYYREFRAIHPALSIERHVDFAENEVPSSVKIVIDRVMQEALSNETKHSQAIHISFYLIKDDHHLEFTVRDGGVGFNLSETVAKKNLGGGIGLLGMRQRTELSAIFFGVESTEGQETTIHASWPLNTNS